MNASTLVQKLSNHCNALCEDGMRYGNLDEATESETPGR